MNILQNRNKKNITRYYIILLSCFTLFCGCSQNEPVAEGEMSALEALTEESISVEVQEESIIEEEKFYKEQWYFEPYSKHYYIEVEEWGTCGLEEDTELAARTGIDQLELEEGEHVVHLQTYDYQVCDYIEEEVYTLTVDNTVKTYIILLNREYSYIGSIKKREIVDENDVEYEKERIAGFLENVPFLINPVTYEPYMRVQDINGDGYVDMYSGHTIYLYEEGEFRLYEDGTCEDCEDWKKFRGMTQEDLEKRENLTSYMESCTTLIADEDGRREYLQFHDIEHADKINDKIVEVLDTKDVCTDKSRNLYAREIIYIGEDYLVLHMFSQKPGEYTMMGEPQCEDSRYLTFDLNTGELVTFEKIVGSDYAVEDAREVAWIAYEREMEKIPDRYSAKEFDSHYDFIEKYYDEAVEGGLSPVVDEYVKYYYTDEGIVFTYCRTFRYGFSGLPIHYYLDERLEPMITEFDVVKIFCPWEELNEE